MNRPDVINDKNLGIPWRGLGGMCDEHAIDELSLRAAARGHRGHREDACNPVEGSLDTRRVVEIGDGPLRSGSCEGLRGRFLRVADQRPYAHPGDWRVIPVEDWVETPVVSVAEVVAGGRSRSG